jgi:hypothetical protein
MGGLTFGLTIAGVLTFSFQTAALGLLCITGIDRKTSGSVQTPPYSFKKIWHMMSDQLINGGWNVISKT